MPRPKGSSNMALHNLTTDDGSKPRGKMTAYAFFVQTCREEHKKQHPEEQVEFAEFSKKCAERWKTMSEKEKKRFNQMAECDKKRFDVEMATYVSPQTEEKGKRGRKKTKKIKDPNAPRRSMSAFFWFSKEIRPKVKEANPNFGVGDIAKELGRRWAEATPEMKAKYEIEAEKDRERYTKEKKDYAQQQKFGDETNVGNATANHLHPQPVSDIEEDEEDSD